MKIGMMSAWNQDSGVSVHAELIGREWVNMGHRLSVFSFLKTDFHGTAIVGEDEDYVSRCFTTSGAKRPFLNVQPILKADYDIFVTQDLGMLPQDELAKIFHLIKQRAKTVTIIHHNRLPTNPSFYQFDWDAIVCFDDRYHNFLSKGFSEEKLHLLPYPCYPKRCGDRFKAREKLDLPQDRHILLLFGQRAVKEHLVLLPILENISRSLPILLLVVSKRDLGQIKTFKGSHLEILIRKEAPDIERLYTYLHASDILLYHRRAPSGVVVSSTTYQCLGSGCPILALNSNYFYNMDGAVITYTNFEEFEANLIEILNQGPRYLNWQRTLDDFLSRNSAVSVANQYIELFQFLLKKKVVKREAEWITSMQ
ncbi:MAG: hypothetical protein H8D39_03555 [Candidatus Atribacteria bacterium]|nr:hypothetical protein [Candidatus Atribacteria bacterium]